MLFLFGKYWGVTGIAFAFLSATFINLVLNFVIAHSLIGSFLKTFFANLLKPLTFCLLMVLAVFTYQSFFTEAGVLNLLIEIALGGLLFLALTFKYKLSLAEVKAFRKSA